MMDIDSGKKNTIFNKQKRILQSHGGKKLPQKTVLA